MKLMKRAYLPKLIMNLKLCSSAYYYYIEDYSLFLYYI